MSQTTNLDTATPSSIMVMLMTKAQGNLTPEVLQWLVSGADEIVSMETKNLAETLQGLGCLVAGDKEQTGNFINAQEVSTPLFSVSHQLDVLHGFSFIGSQAAYLKNNSF